MIVLEILRLLWSVGSAVAGWFPLADVTGVTAALAATAGPWRYLASLNAFLPATEGLVALGIWLAAYIALHGANLIRRLISHVTGGGGA